MDAYEAQWDRLMRTANVKTAAELSRLLEVTPQAVSQARKKATPSVPTEWAVHVAEMFGVSLDYLLLGRGTPQKGDVDMRFIPLVEARLSAGLGSLETSANSERKYAFRSDFLLRKGNPDTMVLMRVSGDSMVPEIKDGDVVLIDQSKSRVLPGRMYAVGIEEAIYVKQIDTLPGRMVLKSLNPDYAPIEVDMRGYLAEQARIIGQVLWVGREYH